jgi:hypothetical protein
MRMTWFSTVAVAILSISHAETQERFERTASTGAYVVTATLSPRNAPIGRRSIAIDVQSKATGDVRRVDTIAVELHGMLDSIRGVKFAESGSAVVLGSTGASDIALVIDPTRATVVDQWIGYAMSMSSSGRFVAYQWFYPRSHPDPPSVYLVYDLALSPEVNRQSPSSEGFRRHTDVGWPVLPEGYAFGEPFLARDESSSVQRTSDELFWIDDVLVFTGMERNGANQIIAVDLQFGVERASVARRVVTFRESPANITGERLVDQLRIFVHPRSGAPPIEVTMPRLR